MFWLEISICRISEKCSLEVPAISCLVFLNFAAKSGFALTCVLSVCCGAMNLIAGGWFAVSFAESLAVCLLYERTLSL